ncbi:hypothetical protein HB13667_03395 [Pseudomonas putida]|uniref:Uncharacterized protein n=1 Tax=Pseudomonas putida TaxID=303 RepID=A0A0P7DE52_PSEPU|nr:hypothetical protein HB13667_03395 [Pseudomonas putida]
MLRANLGSQENQINPSSVIVRVELLVLFQFFSISHPFANLCIKLLAVILKPFIVLRTSFQGSLEFGSA